MWLVQICRVQVKLSLLFAVDVCVLSSSPQHCFVPFGKLPPICNSRVSFSSWESSVHSYPQFLFRGLCTRGSLHEWTTAYFFQRRAKKIMQGYLEQIRWCKIPQWCRYSFILFAGSTLASFTRSSCGLVLHSTCHSIAVCKPWSCSQNECRLVLSMNNQ